MFHITQLNRGYFISNRYLFRWCETNSPKRDIVTNQPLSSENIIYHFEWNVSRISIQLRGLRHRRSERSRHWMLSSAYWINRANSSSSNWAKQSRMMLVMLQYVTMFHHYLEVQPAGELSWYIYIYITTRIELISQNLSKVITCY